MKKELNYSASKKWEKAWRQELRSTHYKQEIDPWLQKGGKKLGIKNCAQLPINKRLQSLTANFFPPF
jgi:hypothetical protein